MKRKTRIEKENEYTKKFGEIPKDYQERLYWLYDNLHITDKKAKAIIDKYNCIQNTLYYNKIFIVLYEAPEGSPRPRFRLINRANLSNMAINNSSFVHVYSITGAEDNKFMKRLVSSEDFNYLDHIIYTPCELVYTTYFKTPSYYNGIDTFLAELGVYNPITKPDWDNLGKKYSDMSNSNLWLDDRLVISGTVNKKYSVLPRVEIELNYLNMLYNKYQYQSISKIYDGEVKYFK
jgi:Holliday junction resolvase RusA-like endonuclease